MVRIFDYKTKILRIRDGEEEKLDADEGSLFNDRYNPCANFEQIDLDLIEDETKMKYEEFNNSIGNDETIIITDDDKREARNDERHIREYFRRLNEFDDDIEGEDLKNKEKKNVVAYELIKAAKLGENELPLEKVVGHDAQKEELLNVIKWFKNPEDLKKRGVSIPKGVILYGDPGNGKSLLIKEIIKCCDCPVFYYNGTSDVDSINELFKKARETKHAVIIIDELDLLINKDRQIARCLQENLDGVESYDDVLVLTATNDLDDIPDALKRNGRLEKIIYIPEPEPNECLALFKKHFKEFDVELPKDFDDEEIGIALSGVSCASIKSIVNDIVLRNGFENVTIDNIYDSIARINSKVQTGKKEKLYEVAIHEAGHAVVANQFKEFFKLQNLNMNGGEGSFGVHDLKREYPEYEKHLATVKIALGGLLAEKIILNKGSSGCCSDLQRARSTIYHLVNAIGYNGCYKTLPSLDGTRRETYIKRRKNERIIERMFKKSEKETIKIIKNNKYKIIALADVLYKKNRLMPKEIHSIID